MEGTCKFKPYVYVIQQSLISTTTNHSWSMYEYMIEKNSVKLRWHQKT